MGRKIIQILHGFYHLSKFACLFLMLTRIRSLLQRLFLDLFISGFYWCFLKKELLLQKSSFICRLFINWSVLNKLICISSLNKVAEVSLFRDNSAVFAWWAKPAVRADKLVTVLILWNIFLLKLLWGLGLASGFVPYVEGFEIMWIKC